MKGSSKVKIAIAAFVILLLLGASVGGGSNTDDLIDIESPANLSAAVEKYRVYVSKKSEAYGMSEYLDLVLCVMEVESHGEGLDPMQSAEGPFNKKYPKVPNGIQDPHYSIDCGIQELQSVLKEADVSSPTDVNKIKVALAGYNFGNGYIQWVKTNKGGEWTLDNAKEFSLIMANKMGWSMYGDPGYVDKVMGYYLSKDETISGKDAFLVPLKNYTLTSGFGSRGLDGFHYGMDLDGGYGANIYAPASGKVYTMSNSCPPTGGYLGNTCPYSGSYIGGGNYIMIEIPYKRDNYYVFICHMKRVTVQEGQEVKKGQKIGEQGHSGNSTASHAHIEVHKNNSRIHTMDGVIDPSSIMNVS